MAKVKNILIYKAKVTFNFPVEGTKQVIAVQQGEAFLVTEGRAFVHVEETDGEYLETIVGKEFIEINSPKVFEKVNV